jgi:hypothetical protein
MILSVRHNYNNTVIYKISCKDKTISEVYIGHTINFDNRKQRHICRNHNNSSPKLYDFIKLNGGWDNWEFSILGTYKCNSRGHASRIEWFWWSKYTNTLNYSRPGTCYLSRDMKKHDNMITLNNIFQI